MKTLFLLAVALIITELPPAFALNCTLYEGEQNELCGVVNPLELSDSEKESLMQPSIYGNIDPDTSPIVLNLNMPQEQALTLDRVYEENVVRAWQILLFTFVHYFAYSVATKSSTLMQWLRVDS